MEPAGEVEERLPLVAVAQRVDLLGDGRLELAGALALLLGGQGAGDLAGHGGVLSRRWVGR
ncbi:hypothetical protein [Cellulomonas denverensis]|uniref:hypothetical protein n=1 Tax=Cellulomonas denverensis TaxID=264297 RepID=UPI0035EAE8CB